MGDSLQKDIILFKDGSSLRGNGNSSTPIITLSSASQSEMIYYEDPEQERAYKNHRENIINNYKVEIGAIIKQDEFIDGEESRSETYAQENLKGAKAEYILEALMQLYYESLHMPHMLEGILLMLSCVDYEIVEPKGQLMAMGLLSNKELSVRDRAIQCFERWNSKKGLEVLKSLRCHPAWLQNYVNKVIMYIERDGVE